MPHAQALVLAADPSEAAAGLARRLGHEFRTEWSAEAGFIELAEGTCTFHTWPEGLRLDAFADTSEHLGAVERFIAQQLASANGVEVAWRRRPLAR